MPTNGSTLAKESRAILELTPKEREQRGATATEVCDALLYAFGGQPFQTGAGQLSSIRKLATPAGLAIPFKNLYFSYITYLAIGYGNIGPQGALARVLAGLEVYLSVILGGPVLYALVKPSEL